MNLINYKPTLHSHTHYQAAQATAQTKAWQRVCLSQRTTDRQSGRKTEGQQLTAPKKNWRFSASYESFVVKETFVLRMNICGENRQLLLAAKRYKVLLLTSI
jgi:hypothetical protein